MKRLLLLLSLSFVFAQLADADSAEPNLLVIYADDLGYGDVQCYNPQRGKIPTPHIDKLAAQGMRFTDGHSSSGVCSPSRYTLLTGRYHWRSRLQSGIVALWGAPLIAPDRMTIGTLAKQHGYRTACIGKWHLGWDWPIPKESTALMTEKPKAGAGASDVQHALWKKVFAQPIANGPTTCGFDSFFGVDLPNWPPFCFIENDRTVGIPSVFRGGPALKGWTFEPILPALADRAAAFITASAKKPEPFLLYLPLTSPHTPIAPNKEWQGKSGLNPYADFVMETDAVIGKVFDAIEKSGAADDTLVVFTSDNGCSPSAKIEDLEKMGHYPSGPLRGAKADAWEGGHRVPFIVRWPGMIKPRSTCDQLVHQADLIRTFADVLGAKLPDNAGEDSISLLPLLKGENKPIRENAVSASIGGTPALRSGSWKYIAAPGSGGWSKGGDQSGPVQLYNLADDLGETMNLAAAMPEKITEMKALLERLIADGRSTPGAQQKNDVEVLRYPRKESPRKNNTLEPKD